MLMKKNHLWATMKLCLLALGSSTLLFTSCAKDGFDDETWSSDVKNTQLQSPQANDITIAATTDKSKTVISWKAIGGARAYKVIVNNVTEQVPVTVVDSIIDGVSFTIPRPEDSNFTMSILTLANTGLGNKDAESATVVNFTSFVQSVGTIPSGTDLSAYFKANPIPTEGDDLPEEFCYDLEPSGIYTISDSLDFASVSEDGTISYPVTLRCTDKNNRPTITITSTAAPTEEDPENKRYGRISTTVPLTLQNLNFDYSNIPDDQAAKTAAIFLSDKTNLPVVGSTFKYVIKGGALQCKNCDFTGLKGMFLFDNNKLNYCIETFILDNCRIHFQIPGGNISTKAFFYLQMGFVKDFYIRNSTLWNTGSGNIQYVISYNNSGRIDRAGYDRAVDTESVNFNNSTLYNIGYGNFANYPGFAGQSYTCFDIQNNIFVDAGKGGAGIARRLLGGRAASSYTKKCVFSQNTYWTNGEAEKEGAPASVEGATSTYDTSGNALQSNPALNDPINNDLTPTGSEQVEKKTGDPYWF